MSTSDTLYYVHYVSLEDDLDPLNALSFRVHSEAFNLYREILTDMIQAEFPDIDVSVREGQGATEYPAMDSVEEENELWGELGDIEEAACERWAEEASWAWGKAPATGAIDQDLAGEFVVHVSIDTLDYGHLLNPEQYEEAARAFEECLQEAIEDYYPNLVVSLSEDESVDDEYPPSTNAATVEHLDELIEEAYRQWARVTGGGA